MTCPFVPSMTLPSCPVPPPVSAPSSTPVAPVGPVAHIVPHLATHVPLAFTGADIREIAFIGVAAVLTGLALKFKRRSTIA